MISKIFKYIAFTVAVIAIIIVILIRERAPFGGKNSSFAAVPKKEITAIEMSDNQKKLKLVKKGDIWVVNDNFETRKSSIVFIQQILSGLEIKSPVSPELFDNEIVNKKVKPVRVKVFENRKVIKSFNVYKTQSNVYGNIMKLREGSKPFIVCIPGSETDIGSAFTLNQLFWQPYTVFNLLPSEILSVTLENVSDTGSSFTISKTNQRFNLTGTKGELSGWDTSRVDRYVSYFVHIPFESWDFDLNSEAKEKLKNQEPLYRITVTRENGEKISLTLWERITYDQGGEKKDTDRLWAKMSAKDEIFIIRYLDIDPILKKRSYFFHS